MQAIEAVIQVFIFVAAFILVLGAIRAALEPRLRIGEIPGVSRCQPSCLSLSMPSWTASAVKAQVRA